MCSLIVPCSYLDIDRAVIMLRNLSCTAFDLPEEIILVISGSEFQKNSELEALSNKFQNLRVIWRKETAFAGDNRNYGADRSNGDIICFHDADDDIHPAKISIIKHIFKNSTIDVIVHLLQPYGYEWQNYDNFDNIPLVSHKLVKENGFESRRWGQFGGMHCGQVSIRAEVFKKLKFDSSMRIGQDRHFLQQCLKADLRCTVAQAFLVKYDGLPNLHHKAAKMTTWKKIDEPNGLGKVREKENWREVLKKTSKIVDNLQQFPFTFWINLDCCTERRTRMEIKLLYTHLNNKSERFSAVDSENSNLEDDLIFVPTCDRKQLACNLSHLKLIKYVFENRPELKEFVVLEDNVDFECAHLWLKPFRDYVSCAPNDWKVLVLGSKTDDGIIRTELENAKELGFDWVAHKTHHNGTFAMMINRQGMQELLSKYFNTKQKKFDLSGCVGRDYTNGVITTQLPKGVYTCTTTLIYSE